MSTCMLWSIAKLGQNMKKKVKLYKTGVENNI